MSRGRACIVADGGPGQALAGQLQALLPDAAVAGSVAGASWAIRVSWRDVDREFGEFAVAASAAGVPWLPVAFGGRSVRVGPAVVPGLAPCHGCYAKRVRQHRADEWDDQVAYELDAGLGVTGYPPHLLAIAAGQAVALVLGGTPRAGEVRVIDCETDEVTRLRVVPTHGCETCDPVGVPPPGLLDRLRTAAVRR